MEMEEKSNFSIINGKFACTKCNYQSNRLDNLKRHIEDKHLKVKVSCEKCGKQLTKSAFSRHKKLSCANSTKSKPSKQFETTPIETVLQSDSIVSIQRRTIPLNLEITKMSDGKVFIKSDDIQIDGLLFHLVQKEGKMIFVQNRKSISV